MTDWVTIRNATGAVVRTINHWEGKLTTNRERGPYSATLSSTLTMLKTELKMLNASNIVIELAIDEAKIRQDGLPRSDARYEHPGVILSFKSKMGYLNFAFDGYRLMQNNFRAIVMCLHRLRMVNADGVCKTGQQYSGWKALPAGEPTVEGDKWA